MTIHYNVFVAIFLLAISLLVTVKCHSQQCNEASFPCMDSNGIPRCIPNSWICDGYSDCFDNMDEANCYYEEKNCTANTNNEVVQCGAYRCLPSNSPLLCNGVIDCRGYNGTYVYAPYGVDESLDYCQPSTTPSTTLYTSSMGWQPNRFSNWWPINFTPRPFASLTAPPFTQITTTDAFWRSYCSRQVAINYCPRRCELHGLCSPLRINPPRWELSKMADDFNPPVVGPVPRTRSTTTAAVSTTTTKSVKQRLLEDNLLERIINEEEGQGRQDHVGLPAISSRNSNNVLDGNGKKRRDSNGNVDPDTMADTNTIYDWSDGERYGERSSSSTKVAFWSPRLHFVTIIATLLLH